MLQGIAIAVLALLPAVTQAAVFPDKIGAFEKFAPKAASLPDRPLMDEFGLDATEQADFKAADKRHFTATAWRFKDATGAMAFFQSHRPSGAPAAPLAKLAVQTSDGTVYAFGNYVFQFTGSAIPTQEELQPVYAALPKFEQSPMPALMGFLPAANLIPNSERYVLGPVSLDRFEPRIAPSIAAFHLGAEAQLAKYTSPKGQLNLAIFYYPTPNMARDRLPQFESIPGAKAKRAGPLVAVTIDPPDLDAAERLLALVRYEASLTLSQKPPVNEVKGFARTVINIFILSGVILGMCLVAGLAFGGYRIIARKLGRDLDPEAMITLGLDGK